VPASEAQVQARMQDMRAELRLDVRAREVLGELSRIRLPVPMAGLSRRLFLGAGTALLPAWAGTLLELSPAKQAGARAVVKTLAAMGPLFRVALADGTAQRGCRRAGVPDEVLYRW